jgi:tRNA1(Val) A37 N6-methylase TrmN6
MRVLEAVEEGSGSTGPVSAALAKFARLCFNTFSGKPNIILGNFSKVLLDLADYSAQLYPQKPRWAIEAEIVLHLSERLLGTARPTDAASKAQAAIAVHRVRRRDCGTYSTPNYIVDDLICRVLAVLRRSGRSRQTPCRIVDLSVEAGHFPLVLAGQKVRPGVEFFGFDRDPEAIALSSIILSQVSGLGGDGFRYHLKLADSVAPPFNHDLAGGADAVIGNPPWKTLHPTDVSPLREAYAPFLQGRFDVYLSFILRADELLRPGGVLGFVLPSAFLYNDNATKVRQFLLEKYDPIHLSTYCRRTFVELPSVAPVTIVLKKHLGRSLRRHSTRNIFRSFAEPVRPEKLERFDAHTLWGRPPRYIYSHIATQPTGWVNEPCQGRASLAELGSFSTGAKLSRLAKLATDVDFIAIGASNLCQFHVDRTAGVVYKAGDCAFERRPAADHLLSPKVFFQTVRCVSLPRRLVAAAGKDGELSCSTAAMFAPTDTSLVDFFVGLLNSAMVNAWYKAEDHNHGIKISVLKRLTIPFDPTAWRAIGKLARCLARTQGTIHTNRKGCGALCSPGLDSPNDTKAPLLTELDDRIFELFKISRPERSRYLRLSQLRFL